MNTATEPPASVEHEQGSVRAGTRQRLIVITTSMRPLTSELLARYEVVGLARSLPRKTCCEETSTPLWRFALTAAARRAFGFLRGKRIRSLKRVASRAGCRYLELDRENGDEFERWVRALEPDLIVVVCMSRLLPSSIFSIPRHGTINLHPAMLPSYRGPNPVFWMFHDMTLAGGTTVHQIDDGEDTGAIIDQEPFEIPLGATSGQVLATALDEVGGRLLTKSIDRILAGERPRIPQPESSPTTRARNVRCDERFVVWEEWGVRRVFHFLRGTAEMLESLPRPSGMLGGGAWRVVGFEEGTPDGRTPAEIYRDGGRWFVACTDGRVELDRSFELRRMVRALLERRDAQPIVAEAGVEAAKR